MYSSFGVSALVGSLLVKLLQEHIGFGGLIYIGLGLTVVALVLTHRLDEYKVFDYVALYRRITKDEKADIVPDVFTDHHGVKVRTAYTQTFDTDIVGALYPVRPR